MFLYFYNIFPFIELLPGKLLYDHAVNFKSRKFQENLNGKNLTQLRRFPKVSSLEKG